MDIVADLTKMVPLAGALGIELQSADPDEIRGTMPWRADLCTSGNVLHGGALMAFADTLGATCAFVNLPEGAVTTTIESKTNFLRAVTDGVVTGVAKPLHVGRRTIVVQTQLSRDDGKPAALVTQTQAVIT
jgi:1,4-dihydroxy-2-naphthoyl-CoA hydrolase